MRDNMYDGRVYHDVVRPKVRLAGLRVCECCSRVVVWDDDRCEYVCVNTGMCETADTQAVPDGTVETPEFAGGEVWDA